MESEEIGVDLYVQLIEHLISKKHEIMEKTREEVIELEEIEEDVDI